MVSSWLQTSLNSPTASDSEVLFSWLHSINEPIFLFLLIGHSFSFVANLMRGCSLHVGEQWECSLFLGTWNNSDDVYFAWNVFLERGMFCSMPMWREPLNFKQIYECLLFIQTGSWELESLGPPSETSHPISEKWFPVPPKGHGESSGCWGRFSGLLRMGGPLQDRLLEAATTHLLQCLCRVWFLCSK